MKRLLLLLILYAGIVLAGPALGVQPDEILDDPVLETRARAISANLRCLVCQNQSIDDSDATLAADLRVLVRERLTAGDSDREVIDYVVARYGEFVLLNPVFGWHTIALWAAAPVALLLGVVALLVLARRPKPPPAPAGMSQQEQDAIARLAASDD